MAVDLFRKISLKVHPDIVGNTALNNERMCEVLKFRTNEDMLEDLARKWGLEIDGRIYTAPRNFMYFRTVFGKIYMVEKEEAMGSFSNIKLKATFDDNDWSNCNYIENEVNRRFETLCLYSQFRYDVYRDIDILVKTAKVFKMYGLIRTTKKCVYVIDNGREKRYNMTSVIGRRVRKIDDNSWNWE